MRPLFAPHLSSLLPYVPGKPIEETEREYGVHDVAKLASNENCLGPSPKAVEALRAYLSHGHLYPDAGGFYLKERLVELHRAHGVTAKQIVLGNGTNELITLLGRALLGPGDKLLNAWPSFVCYRIVARAQGVPEVAVPLDATLGYDLPALARAAAADPAIKLLYVANPNNPTGRMLTTAQLDAFFAELPADVVVVLDEAYAEYVVDPAYPNGMAWVQRRPRTVVLRTFSKIYGLASLRIGYAVADPEIALVLDRLRDPFNTSAAAQVAALAALDDAAHVDAARAHNAAELPRLARGLTEHGFSVTPSVGNFLLAEVQGDLPEVPALNDALLRRGVIVRPVANYGLTRHVRVTVGKAAENQRLLAAIDDLLAQRRRRLTKPLIVALDGPAGAGKSTVAKLVAERSGLALVDTGAIYRSVGLLALRRGVSVDDGDKLGVIAAELSVSLRFQWQGGQNRVFLGDEDVSQAIRTPEASAASSAVSRHPQVRGALLELQRQLGRRAPGAVLEGRDIGTVVFPDALVKAFVTASPEERARRRMKELEEKGHQEPFDKVHAEIVQRDRQDSERAAAPLKPAADAVVVDTTGKTLDEVTNAILALLHRAG